MSKHLAVTQNRKASLAADRGESVTPYKPSNSSSVSNSGQSKSKSYVMQPMPVHSRHNQSLSDKYHSSTVDASYTRPSSTKMTKAEHQLNNDEDYSEKGHKL